MSIELIALIILFIVIAIGFWKKANVGLLAIAAAVVLGYGSGQYTGKDIIKGFSSSLFMTLLGVTLFFGLVQTNGCIELFMKKVTKVFGKKVWMIPILMYIIGWIIAAIGPGCVPALAFVGAVAIPLAHETEYDPVMLMLIGFMGSYGGRFSPITPEGVLINNLMTQQGATGFNMPVFINATLGSIILSVIPFMYYKGYKVKATGGLSDNKTNLEKFNSKQIFALFSILGMIVCVIFLKMDVGLASFLVSAILILTKTGSEKEAIKNVPWSTLIMVCGVGVLMNLIIGTGGIKLLATTMASIMTPGTAAGITGITAAVMSWFSSAIGVVMPTLIPTVGTIVEQVGGSTSAIELVTVISIFSSVAGISPASTGGAIILGAYHGDPTFSKEKRGERLFIECLIWAVVIVVFLAIITFTGIFGIIG